MSEKKHVEVPDGQWLDLSDSLGSKNGRASNTGNSTIVYFQGENKPDESSTKDHRLVDNNFFDFVVKNEETIWVKALNGSSTLSVTPDLAVGVLGGAMDVHYVDKVGSGEFSTRNISFIKDSSDVVIALNGDDGDQVQFVIQDDITSLIDFKANFQGHVIR